MSRLRLALLLLSLAAGGDRLLAQDCLPEMIHDENSFVTDQFALEAGSAVGASGDVVSVQFVLTAQLPNASGLMLAVCHDPAVAEILGDPVYSDEFLSILGPGGAQFLPVDDRSPELRQVGYGFLLNSHIHGQRWPTRFPSQIPLPVMTVYYRLLGSPGQTSSLDFCDARLARAMMRCTSNFILNIDNAGDSTDYLSTANVSGTLTVREGEVTQPDRPPEPPKATVYQSVPSQEEANFRVRITGGTAFPGETGVAVDVYVQAGVEYTSVLIPLDFDERYLRLTTAEDHFIAGGVNIHNGDTIPGAGSQEGTALILSGSFLSTIRLGGVDEEVHAATLYFDVLPEAAAVDSTEIVVAPITDQYGVVHPAYIGVRHVGNDGLHPETTSQVDPLLITNGVLALQAEPVMFLRGDSNSDRAVDLSDAQFTLNHLFLSGAKPSCLDAADANDDGIVNISDPISVLQALFLGGPQLPSPSNNPGEDPSEDSLGCDD